MKNNAFIVILALLISGFLSLIFIDSVSALTGPISVSLTANQQNVNKGEAVTLSWNSTNADFCVAHSNTQSPWYGVRPISGTEVITPNQTAVYLITCSNSGGFSRTVQTTVTAGETSASPVSVNITANPESIFRGESTTLIWSSNNATSCEASGYWSGLKRPFGSESVSPSTTVSYTLRCNNSLGQYSSDTQVIFVNPSSPVSITPKGQFNAACVAEPSRALIGQAVIFAGAQSRGTEPVTYKWSGDVSGTTQTVKTSFATAGTKTAQLTVTDASGKTVSATCSVQVGSGITSIGPIIKTSKISAPTNLKPNNEEFPSRTKEVTLSWNSVQGAKFYAVRAEPMNKTEERDSRNNCPGNPHYLCVNNLDSTSIKLEVKPGNTYSWWIHSVDANGSFSDSAFVKFSVKAGEVKAGGNFFANIFGSTGRTAFILGLVILAFILGYIFGKRKTKAEPTLNL